MQGLLDEVIDNGSIYTCAEDGEVAMVDARDIAVAAAALTGEGHDRKTYTLTGSELSHTTWWPPS